MNTGTLVAGPLSKIGGQRWRKFPFHKQPQPTGRLRGECARPERFVFLGGL